MYDETAVYNKTVYWLLFLALIASGVWKLLHSHRKAKKGKNTLTTFSFILGITVVLCLVLAREAYAAAMAILLLLIKGLLIFYSAKSGF